MATTLILSFPGGRYHATPWGHHVNEGLVEWPPSPWRILRALISVGYTKLHAPDPLPLDHPLRRTVLALAEELPTYTIPKSSPATHSRHYMPLASGKTTLVMDACAKPGGLLAVSWSVDLEDELREYLSQLASQLSYVGRAESWVEARLLAPGEPVPHGLPVVPHASMTPPPRGTEQIAMLAPVASADYDAWIAEQIAVALEQLPELPEGKKPTKKALQERERAVAPYPPDLFDAMQSTTPWLQKHGWALPPGTRKVIYNRHISALDTANPRVRSKPLPHSTAQAVLLALASSNTDSDVLPTLSRCLPQAELLHRALVARAGRGERFDSPCLTGRERDGTLCTGHQHLHILPVSLDQPGHLDHFLLWAPMGIDPISMEAIYSIRQTWTKGDEDGLYVTVVGTGAIGDFASLLGPGDNQSPLLGVSAEWTSLTPFVPPRFMKKNRNSLAHQIAAELACRGLPEPTEVEILDREVMAERRFHRFVRTRREPAPQPPQNVGLAITIRFAVPVEGPIALGYASHFGLGLFGPVFRR